MLNSCETNSVNLGFQLHLIQTFLVLADFSHFSRVDGKVLGFCLFVYFIFLFFVFVFIFVGFCCGFFLFCFVLFWHFPMCMGGDLSLFSLNHAALQDSLPHGTLHPIFLHLMWA